MGATNLAWGQSRSLFRKQFYSRCKMRQIPWQIEFRDLIAAAKMPQKALFDMMGAAHDFRAVDDRNLHRCPLFRVSCRLFCAAVTAFRWRPGTMWRARRRWPLAARRMLAMPADGAPVKTGSFAGAAWSNDASAGQNRLLCRSGMVERCERRSKQAPLPGRRGRTMRTPLNGLLAGRRGRTMRRRAP